MGLLTGGAKALFGELLAPLYVAATVKGQATTYTPGGALRRVPTNRPCRVQVDVASERMREGFTEVTHALYVLAATLDGDVDTDAEVVVGEGHYAGSTFRIASADLDTAGAGWFCRGVKKVAANG